MMVASRVRRIYRRLNHSCLLPALLPPPATALQGISIYMADPAQTSANTLEDDTFQLYDLRIEVVCPPGERMMCGAKVGDYFTLEGEMLYLPPGQGISIYSLGERRPSRRPIPVWRVCIHVAEEVIRRSAPASCRKAAHDIKERLDVDRRRRSMPRPKLPKPVAHRAHRRTYFQTRRYDRRAPPP